MAKPGVLRGCFHVAEAKHSPFWVQFIAFEFFKLSLAHRIGFGNKYQASCSIHLPSEDAVASSFLPILIIEIELALLLGTGESLDYAKQRISVSHRQPFHLQSRALTVSIWTKSWQSAYPSRSPPQTDSSPQPSLPSPAAQQIPVAGCWLRVGINRIGHRNQQVLHRLGFHAQACHHQASA